MSPPDPDQIVRPSAFSWESVVGADPDSGASELDGDGAADSSDPFADPSSDTESTLGPISLTIAPLSLDPLPPVPSGGEVGEAPPSVIGEVDFTFTPLRPAGGLKVPPVAPPSMPVLDPIQPPSPPAVEQPPPAVEHPVVSHDVPAVAPPSEHPVVSGGEAEQPVSSEVMIAPLDMPDLTRSGSTPVVGHQGHATRLPDDPVGPDATPTTTIDIVPGDPSSPGAASAMDHAPTIPPVPTITVSHQPSQANLPRVATAPARFEPEPAPAMSRRQRRAAEKQKKSGAGAFAVIFTVLVLGGLIAGGIVFGRPYLFPDDWDAAARPYADAVEEVRGTAIAEPVLVSPQSSATYAMTMTEAVIGDWTTDLPMWRSFGMVNGTLDAALLNEMVLDWTTAFYAPATAEIIVNEALEPAAVDGAIVEAMTAAALDQERGWSATIDGHALDRSALTRAEVIAESRTTAAASTFGAAVSGRRIEVAEFLPPVLSYRVNAPLAFAEIVPTGSGRLEAIAAMSALKPAPAPELSPGDTIVEPAVPVDRGFWYLVFASYVDAPGAYAASNALVEASLVTADRAGRLCSYATFSGSDVDGTARVSEMLQQWAATAPPDLAATYSVLVDGTMQLSTCDPGSGFETGARFGVSRELIRWRLVELAAVDTVDPLTGTVQDAAAEVQRVRAAGIGVGMLDLPYGTSAMDEADTARVFAAVSTAPQPSSEIAEPVGD